jgi:hypothetical protein
LDLTEDEDDLKIFAVGLGFFWNVIGGNPTKLDIALNEISQQPLMDITEIFKLTQDNLTKIKMEGNLTILKDLEHLINLIMLQVKYFSNHWTDFTQTSNLNLK